MECIKEGLKAVFECNSDLECFRINLECREAVAGRCSVRKEFLKISQNSQESTCVGVSFLIELLAYFIKKRGSNTSVFPWILWNFQRRLFIEHLRWQFLNVMKKFSKTVLKCTKTSKLFWETILEYTKTLLEFHQTFLECSSRKVLKYYLYCL